MNDETSGDPAAALREGDEADRRDFLATSSHVAMAGGLVAGYGTFFYMAGRFLYPASPQPKTWMFVAPAAEIAPGDSLTLTDPTGATIVIARREKTDQQEEGAAEENPTVDEFIALSSVCPHLGCRVHWETRNQRFFCPCHNGVFDPDGLAIEGPPAATDPPQSLSRYPLKIDGGNLMIEVPTESIGGGARRAAVGASALHRQVEEA